MNQTTYREHFKVAEKLELHDRLVVPSLVYGADLWGAGNVKRVEVTYNNYIRRCLGVKRSTPLSMLHLESGKLPMQQLVEFKMLRVLVQNTRSKRAGYTC